MAVVIVSSKISIFLFICACVMVAPSSNDEQRKVYIVYMGSVDITRESASSFHLNLLQNSVDSRFSSKSLLRSYSRSFHGFAANLTAQERDKLAGHEDIVMIFPSITYNIQTTRSWDFMGFDENVIRNPTVESDTIIGVIDTGIWPESESFDDRGFGPPPIKWKGACNGGENFTCNNKLIGARHYTFDASARDTAGHGTHTASTAAGNLVKDASFYEIAKGTARGGVPLSRIAAYKVCNPDGCQTEDMLAAFDDAIADGVDIITISIGGTNPVGLEDDAGIALGALHAFQKGVLVTQSAGNSGLRKSVSSVMPWIFTVAASSTDRAIVTNVSLGNGKLFTGKAVSSVALAGGTSVPVVYGEKATLRCKEKDAWKCDSHCLEPSLVTGKIILCDDDYGVPKAFKAGAIGVVTRLPDHIDVSLVVPLSASCLKRHDFKNLKSYFESTRSPTLDILKSESVRNVDAPKVSGFSSRGPNMIFPDILKPDVTAPGMEILAAYSPLASPSDNPPDCPPDKRSVNYNVLSGTSMSCPHVAGAAAYVRSFNPNWSPSAIKSALMTTAWRMDASRDPLAEFSYGAGHIDPVKAVSPGLVYETFVEDYIKMFCSLGYNSTKVQKIFGVYITCPDGPDTLPKDLNYPSMTSQIETSRGNKRVRFNKTFRRTVTNVGPEKSIYTVTTSTGPHYKITVQPSILTFVAVGEKRSFDVIISGKISYGKMVSASLEWSDGVHNVSSPIVVYAGSPITCRPFMYLMVLWIVIIHML